MTATKPTTSNDLIRMGLALAELDIKPSTFYVAAKRHSYLRDAIVTEVHPDTGKNWTRISKAAIDRYAKERRPGHSSNGNETGLKRAMYLADDEVARAEQVLSETFGREIVITRAFKSTTKEDDAAE